MQVFNLGSINLDHVYRVGRLPAPGETVAARSLSTGLGGKGANQSVAVARAGARVCHIGAVGPDGDWAVARLEGFGVDCGYVARLSTVTGHAVIMVDDGAENSILIHPGANRALGADWVAEALAAAQPGDALLTQNETSAGIEAAALARARGMHVIHTAAPFDAAALRDLLPHLTLLMLNALEAEQMQAALGCGLADLGVPEVIVTRGAEGADWHLFAQSEVIRVPAFPVRAVDTTGAGDTFAGYLVAGLAQGLTRAQAARRAAAASAIAVCRAGAAEAIPAGAEVDAFLATRA